MQQSEKEQEKHGRYHFSGRLLHALQHSGSRQLTTLWKEALEKRDQPTQQEKRDSN
jgi:hypothetical protein